MLLIPAVIIYSRYSKKRFARKRKKEIAGQFRDALISLAAALSAGYSMENAMKEALSEVGQIYGEDALLCKELKMVINQTMLNRPLEDALDDMAARCGVDDMNTFAAVFRVAKRSGGNMAQMVRKSADDIAAKADVENEITVLISSKKLEQTLMLFMPLAMILYIDLTSPGLLDPLYGNVTGVIIMTVCLGIYVLSFFLAAKIMNIEV